MTNPGLYTGMSEEWYHGDPASVPSLSASIASIMVEQSPLHAWWAHPRLNPNHRAVNKREFDLGTAVHTTLLGTGPKFEIIDAADYRTKAAKTARDDAYADGKTPLLVKQKRMIDRVCEAARAQLAALPDGVGPNFKECITEASLIWKEGETWFRVRPDLLYEKHGVIWDIKSTSGSAHPDVWSRTQLWPQGKALQAALYRRGAKAVLEGWDDWRFRFIVIELSAPYAVSIIEMTPQAMALAERKLDTAISLWRSCMETDRWPGYPTQIAYVDAPTWMEYQQEEREARDEIVPLGEAG